MKTSLNTEVRDNTIKLISKQFLNIQDLTVKNWDSEDFKDLHVRNIKKALEEAYHAGVTHAICRK